MAEQTTISIDSIMEQAQVFASAWSLFGGPFDDGSAQANAEQARDELREMLEDFCSNVDMKIVAEQLVMWHQRKMGNIETVLGSPADTEIRLGEEDPIILTGDKLKGFRMGMAIAQQWFGDFPLQTSCDELAEEE